MRCHTVYTCVCVHTHTHTLITHTHTHPHTHTHTHTCMHAHMHACTHACAVRRCLAFFDKMVGMNFLLSTQECDETTQFTCAQVRALLQSTGFARDDVAQVLCVWVCPREGGGGCAVLWVWVCPCRCGWVGDCVCM